MFLVILAILVASCYTDQQSLYDKESPVIQLDHTSFDKEVTDDSGLWLIEFYAPWCGHCKSLAPEYVIVADKLKGLIKIGSVNSDNEKVLSKRFSVNGYPTLKIFGRDKKNPVDYKGSRTSDAIIEGLLKYIQTAVAPKKRNADGKPEMDGDLYHFTSDNFDSFIQHSDKPVLVMFYAPWCGHCTSMAPYFKAAATELKGTVYLAKVDATVESLLATRYDIKGFPTLKLFTANPEGKQPSFTEYNGGRTQAEIVDWLRTHVGYKPPVVEIVQVTSQSDFEKYCTSKLFCVMAIFPPIEDSSEQERLDQIDILNDAGTGSSGKNWGWIWVSGTTVDNLETALNIDGLSYPILVGIHNEKKVFATLKTSLSKKNIKIFINDIKHGRAYLSSFKTFPKLEGSTPWVLTKENTQDKQEL